MSNPSESTTPAAPAEGPKLACVLPEDLLSGRTVHRSFIQVKKEKKIAPAAVQTTQQDGATIKDKNVKKERKKKRS